MSYTKANNDSERDQIIYEFLQSAQMQQSSPGMGMAVGLNTTNDGMKYFNIQVQELSGPPTVTSNKVQTYENPPMEFSFS